MANEPDEVKPKAQSLEAGSSPLLEDSCLREDGVENAGTGATLETDSGQEESHSGDAPKEQGARREQSDSEVDKEEEEEEDGGGPVKTFLEHLEDLRWTIIRCLLALAIAVVVCLIAGNMVVDLLKEPLRKAQRLVKRKNDTYALIQFGTNKWVLDLESNVFGPLQLGGKNSIKLVLSPVQIGTNVVLAFNPAPLDRDELPPVNLIELKNLSPVSPFVVAIKIAVYGGLGLSSPFLLLFIGQFVVPALKRKEKKYLYRALAIGSVLFCAGVLFCYFFMLQIALNAAVQFSKWMGFGADIWRAEDYIGFVVKFLVGMGLSFELPVVLLTLVKLELLDYRSMNKFRAYWVVVNLVISAILTPPDVVSQMLMAIPLQLLYEFSVLIAWYWYRRDEKRLAALGPENALYKSHRDANLKQNLTSLCDKLLRFSWRRRR
jgi:sec-independent protein translocase protein TatC